MAAAWRQVLAEDQTNARPIISSLLVGRVTITPASLPKTWDLRGRGTLAGLFEKTLPLGMASPAGFEPAVSTLKGSRAGPLHHGDLGQPNRPSILT